MERITHELKQGTPEWLAYRATMDNASDAAAMLGISPYKTRDELLKERYLGLSRDISDYVQERILNPGHEFEAKAREVAETIMEADLYPVTMSLGTLSASLDGLTVNHRQSWEHKKLSRELEECMPAEFSPAEFLPKYHRVQVEHQFMVTDAEETLFTASKWNGDQLLDMRHAWVFPDVELRAEIEAGWEQFRIDLANYVPPKAEPPKAVGKTMASLPALFVVVEGRVTETNLGPWKEGALAAIRSVNRTLSSDQDFATAGNMLTWCATVEDNCKTASAYILSQTTTVADALQAVKDVQEEARTCRLELDKLVTKRKAERKTEIVSDAVAEFHKHIADLNLGLAPYALPSIPADFAGQTARKSSFDSMQSAVNTELARAKVAANTLASGMKVRRALIEAETEFAFLFNDAASLIQKDAETVALIIRTRISDHKAAKAAEEAATRARIAAEEKEKAEAAARAQAAEILRQEREAQDARDRQARADADRLAAQQRDADEQERRRHDAEALAEREKAAADLKAMEAPAPSPVAESIVSSSLEQFEGVSRSQNIAGFNRIVDKIAESVGAPAVEERAWINITKMNEAFGFSVTADFIVNTLGFQWTRTEKAAKFWTPTQFEAIKRKMAAHVLGACVFPF